MSPDSTISTSRCARRLLEIERLHDGRLKVLGERAGASRSAASSAKRRIPGRRRRHQRGTDPGGAGAHPASGQAIRKLGGRPRHSVPQTWPPLDKCATPDGSPTSSPDMILPIRDKHASAGDTRSRNETETGRRPDGGFVLPLSPTLEATWRRAFDHARQRNHRFATLEHLLLALVDDADASAVMRDCKADLGALKTGLVSYLDNEFKDLASRRAPTPYRLPHSSAWPSARFACARVGPACGHGCKHPAGAISGNAESGGAASRRTRRVPRAYGRLYRSQRQGNGLGNAFPLPRG